MSERGSRRPNRWRLVAGLAGLAVVAQLWGLYRVPGPPSSPWFPQVDKVQHVAGFAVPVALLLLALGLRAATSPSLSRELLVVVAAAFALHAVVSEVVHHLLYLRRTGDPFDVLADLVGVALGAAVALTLLRRRTPDRRITGNEPEPVRAVEP